VTDLEMRAIGGAHRLLADILIEVAQGGAEFIYIG
jgi:hypothetical protein